MSGSEAYRFGNEEVDSVMDIIQSGCFFRYGSESGPKFLHKVSTLEKEFAKYSGYPLSSLWKKYMESAIE